jgi:hypothetical protein
VPASAAHRNRWRCRGEKEKPAAEESSATGFQNTWLFALAGFDLRSGNGASGVEVTQLTFDVGLQA